MILPFVLCGCETWLLTLKEGCRLRVFDNSVSGRPVYRRATNTEWLYQKLY